MYKSCIADMALSRHKTCVVCTEPTRDHLVCRRCTLALCGVQAMHIGPVLCAAPGLREGIACPRTIGLVECIWNMYNIYKAAPRMGSLGPLRSRCMPHDAVLKPGSHGSVLVPCPSLHGTRAAPLQAPPCMALAYPTARLRMA